MSSASESGSSGWAASSETVATTRSVGGDVRAMGRSVAGVFEYCNPCAAHFDRAECRTKMGRRGSRAQTRRRPKSTEGGSMHELVIRGGTLVDGTGAPPRPADVAVDDGTHHRGRRARRARRRRGPPHRRRRRPARHPRLRRPPHALRRPGHLGPAAHAVVLARRHHRGDGQLRRRLRAGAPGPGGLAHPAHGGRRGHPRHRAQRGHHLGLGDLPRVPRRARHDAADVSTSARRCRTARCART